MKRIAAVLVVTIATGCRAFQPAPCLSVPAVLGEEKAVRILRTATRVEEDGIGITGAPSCYVAAYRVILGSPAAAERFRDIFRTGTPSARIYALVGLYRSDPQSFRRLRTSAFARSARTVPFATGCVVNPVRISDFVQAIPTACLFVPWGPERQACVGLDPPVSEGRPTPTGTGSGSAIPVLN